MTFQFFTEIAALMATSNTRTGHLPVWVFSDANDANWLGGNSGILNGKFSHLNLYVTMGVSIAQNISSSGFTLVTPTSIQGVVQTLKKVPDLKFYSIYEDQLQGLGVVN